MSTLNIISEKHAKAKENVRMEEQRVDQTQQQIHQYAQAAARCNLVSTILLICRYEQVNDGVRTKIAKLNQQIEQSKEERRDNM